MANEYLISKHELRVLYTRQPANSAVISKHELRVLYTHPPANSAVISKHELRVLYTDTQPTYPVESPSGVHFGHSGWIVSAANVEQSHGLEIPTTATEAPFAFIAAIASADLAWFDNSGWATIAKALNYDHSGYITSADGLPYNHGEVMDASVSALPVGHMQQVPAAIDAPLGYMGGVASGTDLLFDNTGWANIAKVINFDFSGRVDFADLLSLEHGLSLGNDTASPFAFIEALSNSADMPLAHAGRLDAAKQILLEFFAYIDRDFSIPLGHLESLSAASDVTFEHYAMLGFSFSLPYSHAGWIEPAAMQIPFAFTEAWEGSATVSGYSFIVVIDMEVDIPVGWGEGIARSDSLVPIAWGAVLADVSELNAGHTLAVGKSVDSAQAHSEIVGQDALIPVENAGMTTLDTEILFGNTQNIGGGDKTAIWQLSYKHWYSGVELGTTAAVGVLLPFESGEGSLSADTLPAEYVNQLIRPFSARIPVEWDLEGWHPFIDLPGWQADLSHSEWMATAPPAGWLADRMVSDWYAAPSESEWLADDDPEAKAKATNTNWE